MEGWGMKSKENGEWRETKNEEQQQNEDDNQHHENLWRFSQACTIAGSIWLLILKNEYRINYNF